MDEIDTSKTLEVAESKLKLALLILGAAALSAGALSAVVGWPEKSPDDSYTYFFMWFGTIFFPLGTLVLFWRLVRFKGAALVLSPAGVFDRRTFVHPLPWRAVGAVQTRIFRGPYGGGAKQVELTVDPEALEHLFRQKRLGRLALPLPRLKLMNMNTVLIGSADLKITYKALFAAINAYWRAYKAPAQVTVS